MVPSSAPQSDFTYLRIVPIARPTCVKLVLNDCKRFNNAMADALVGQFHAISGVGSRWYPFEPSG